MKHKILSGFLTVTKLSIILMPLIYAYFSVPFHYQDPDVMEQDKNKVLDQIRQGNYTSKRQIASDTDLTYIQTTAVLLKLQEQGKTLKCPNGKISLASKCPVAASKLLDNYSISNSPLQSTQSNTTTSLQALQ